MLEGDMDRDEGLGTAIVGTIEGDSLFFVQNMVNHDGETFLSRYAGVVNESGTAMEGTVHFEQEDGSMIGKQRPWSAKRGNVE